MKFRLPLFIAAALLLLLTAGCASSPEQGTKEKQRFALPGKGTKKDAMDKYLNGLAAEAKGDYASAILEFQDALAIDPQAGIYYSIAKNYFYLSKLAPALQNIRAAVALEPEMIEYYDLLQEIYTSSRQSDSAIAVLERMIALDSTEISAYYKLARLYENKRPSDAIAVYNTITNRIGNDWSVLIRVAELYERLGNIPDAIKSIEGLASLDPGNTAVQKLLIELYVRDKQYDEALAAANDLLLYYPDDLDAIERKAQIFIEQGRMDLAAGLYTTLMTKPGLPLDAKIRVGISYYSAALKDSTLLPAAKEMFTAIDHDTTDWQVKMFLGAIALSEHQDSVAMGYFRMVTELAPWNPQGWIQLGGLYFDNRKYHEAVTLLSGVAGTFSEEFGINIILGISYAQLDDHRNAEPFLKKAAENNPEDLNALSAYGYTLSQVHKPDEAVLYLRKALDISPANVDIMGTLGLIYDSVEKWEQCDSVYGAALALDSANALVNNNYAYSLSKRGVRLEEALRMVEVALRKEPSNASYLDTKGWVLFKMKRYQEARKYIEEALALSADRGVLLDHLGDVLYMLGEKAKAMETWRKAYELDNNNSALKQKIERGTL